MVIKLEKWKFRDDFSVNEFKKLLKIRKKEYLMENPVKSVDSIVSFLEEIRINGPKINGNISFKKLITLLKDIFKDFLGNLEV